MKFTGIGKGYYDKKIKYHGKPNLIVNDQHNK